MLNHESLLRVSREFRDLTADLMQSDTDTFQTSLNFFKDFCDENDVINSILTDIINNPFDSQKWYDNAVKPRGSMVGTGDGTLPRSKLDALKVVYDLLWSDRPLDKLLHLGHSVMYIKNYDEQLRKVNASYSNLLVRYIIRQLEMKIELVKPQSSQQVQNISNNFYAPANVANQSSNFNQNLTYNNEDFNKLITELRSLIDSSDLSNDEKDDAFECVEMIEEEANKENPRKSRIIKIIDMMPGIQSTIEILEKMKVYF